MQQAKKPIRGGGMPKKWTHLKFIVKLVYDLMFPGLTSSHLSTISDLDDRSISLAKTLSLFESVDKVRLEEDIYLDCDTGQEN
jgi:hypothetical protein